MKKGKMFLAMIIVLTSIYSKSYAIEMSMGGSFGGGFQLDTTGFIIEPRFDFFFEFLPFLGFETGLSYTYYQGVYSDGTTVLGPTVIERKTKITKHRLSIPALLRAQIKYPAGVTYVSAGLKFGFATTSIRELESSSSYTSSSDSSSSSSSGNSSGSTSDSYYDQQYGGAGSDSSLFPVIDANFALGQEFLVGDNNYIGLRFTTEIPVIGFDGEVDSIFEGFSLIFALTYRRTF